MTKQILSFITAISLAGLLLIQPVQGQSISSEELEETLKTERLQVGLLLQSVANFSFDGDDGFLGGRAFDLGATRMDFRGQLESNFTYRLQLEYRSSPAVIDAQVGYVFSDQFRIVTGLFKPFLSRDLDPGPGNTDFISRARQVGAMMNTREIGVTALGESGAFYYRLGVYNGTGRSRTNDGRFLYTARLGYTAEQENGSWDFGGNFALDQSEGFNVGNTGIASAGDRLLYGAFVEYDSDTFFGTAEFLETTFEEAGLGEDETITGFYATVGNKITDRSELLVRWDRLAFDLQDDASNRVILGWNHYPARYIQFQVNLLADIVDDGDDRYGAAFNFQFQF